MRNQIVIDVTISKERVAGGKYEVGQLPEERTRRFFFLEEAVRWLTKNANDVEADDLRVIE